MKSCVRDYTVIVAFLLFTVNCVCAQSARTTANFAGGVVTLYAIDPLTRTFCFGDGREGSVFEHSETRNRCSDIDFNNYNENSLTVGIEGVRTGAIVDLGSGAEMQKRYGYEETVGRGQGFASLRTANGRVLILKDRQTHSEQDLAESEVLFAGSKSNASSPIKLGHIYLLRLVDGQDKTFERIVKLLVVSYRPNESVTLRWQTLQSAIE